MSKRLGITFYRGFVFSLSCVVFALGIWEFAGTFYAAITTRWIEGDTYLYLGTLSIALVVIFVGLKGIRLSLKKPIPKSPVPTELETRNS